MKDNQYFCIKKTVISRVRDTWVLMKDNLNVMYLTSTVRDCEVLTGRRKVLKVVRVSRLAAIAN